VSFLIWCKFKFIKNYGTQGSDGATIGKTIFTCVYIGNSLLQKQQPISIKLNANYPCMKGIQVWSSKGPGPHQRGDNHKNVKIGLSHLNKNFALKTIGPEKLRFM
jgi:hypothetical protein